MNAIFDIKRFGMLVKSDWQLNWKQNLLGFSVFAAGIFIFMLASINKPWLVTNQGPNYWYTYNENNWFSYVMLVLAAYLLIILKTSFNQLTTKTTRARYLMLPASHFEKFLYQVLVQIFLQGVILYVILWIDAQLVRTFIISRYDLSEEVVSLFEPFRWLTPFNDADGNWESISMGFIVIGLASLALNANIWFRKFGWLKMVIVVVLLIFAFATMMVGYSHLFYPEATKGFDINTPTSIIPGTEVPLFQAYAFITMDVVWVLLLVIGFFKFKETEL